MGKFIEIGFLSDELSAWIATTRSEFNVELVLAERINRLGMKMLFDLPSEEMTASRAIANLCFGRALQTH